MAVTPTVSPVYTSSTEINYRITSTGQSNMTGGDADTLTFAIYTATQEFDQYTWLYDTTDKSNSFWCRTICTDLAVWHLATLRGNPPQSVIQQRYDRAIQLLERINNGQMKIPGLAELVSGAPTYENVRMVPWGRVQKIRIEPLLSDRQAPLSPLPTDPTGNVTEAY